MPIKSAGVQEGKPTTTDGNPKEYAALANSVARALASNAAISAPIGNEEKPTP